MDHKGWGTYSGVRNLGCRHPETSKTVKSYWALLDFVPVTCSWEQTEDLNHHLCLQGPIDFRKGERENSTSVKTLNSSRKGWTDQEGFRSEHQLKNQPSYPSLRLAGKCFQRSRYWSCWSSHLRGERQQNKPAWCDAEWRDNRQWLQLTSELVCFMVKSWN